MERFLRWITGFFHKSLVGIIPLLFHLDRLRASGTIMHALAKPEGGPVLFLVSKLLEHLACITNIIPAMVLGILYIEETV